MKIAHYSAYDGSFQVPEISSRGRYKYYVINITLRISFMRNRDNGRGDD